MKAIHTTALAALVLALGGCGESGHLQAGFQHISVLDGNSIAVHARNEPDAIISAEGLLSVDGTDVPVTAAQQALLKQYFTNAIALRNDAIATGVAGAATAGTAIRSVVAGLASGEPDTIAPAVQERAAKVELQAAKVCEDLAALRSTQQALVAGFDAFRPYATIDARQVGDCGPKPPQAG